MAAGLGFKEFTTGDVLTAADANGYLASQVVMVFASAAARTSAIASPQQGMISYLKDTNSTQYYSGSAWVALGAAGGKVLQVVMGTSTTSTSISSTTYTDTSLSATITPSATSSKVLCFIGQQANLSSSNTLCVMGMQLLRGSTSIYDFGTSGTATLGLQIVGASFTQIRSIVNNCYLDSPSTTSATTYKTQVKVYETNDTAQLQESSTPSTLILMEIGA